MSYLLFADSPLHVFAWLTHLPMVYSWSISGEWRHANEEWRSFRSTCLVCVGEPLSCACVEIALMYRDARRASRAHSVNINVEYELASQSKNARCSHGLRVSGCSSHYSPSQEVTGPTVTMTRRSVSRRNLYGDVLVVTYRFSLSLGVLGRPSAGHSRDVENRGKRPYSWFGSSRV